MKNNKPITSIALGTLVVLISMASFAAPSFAQLAQIQRLSGTAQVQINPDDPYRTMAQTEQVPTHAHLKTGPTGLVRILYEDGVTITVKPNTTVLIGGSEGAQIRKGNVIIRAQRLISTGAQKTFRTPIAVAAIRGTEFGISVEESGRSSVYVFEGKVAVHNAQIPTQEVLVNKGQMTTVEPLQPPAQPSSFRSGEFDQLGRLNSLERGEDPVLESSEEPADGSYLAFPDHDIDALRNPAYAANITRYQATSTLSAHGSGTRESFEQANTHIELDRSAGYGITGHHVSLVPIGQKLRLGLSARGSNSTDNVNVTVQNPIPWSAEKHHQKTEAHIGEFQAMLAHPLGAQQIGIGAIYRRSDIHALDKPLGKAGEETQADNRLGEVQLGILFGQTEKKLGLKLAIQDLSSTTNSGTLHKHFDGYNYMIEILARKPINTHHLASILRFEHTKTTEQVTDANLPVYNEDRKVWSFKGGMGWGHIPTKTMVMSIDLIGGISKELATQYLPNGNLREDENDLRLSLSAHFGTQIHMGKSFLLTLDATHRLERQNMNFHLLPGAVNETTQRQWITRATTSAITGIGYVGKNMIFEYFIASPSNDHTFSHNVLFIFEILK